jgi:uncharacterized Zn finger protein (UPF0148 family)
MIKTWCPQCGPDVHIDEDGCCAMCGADAAGDGVDEAHKHRRAAQKAQKALERICEETYDTGRYADVTPKKAVDGVLAMSEKLGTVERKYRKALAQIVRLRDLTRATKGV